VATLLDEYVEGTRQWMFEYVNVWLHTALGSIDSGSTPCFAATASSAGPDIPPNSRLLLLLAGPGMGKSVMSAAMETKLMVRTHKNHRLVQVGDAGVSLLLAPSLAVVSQRLHLNALPQPNTPPALTGLS